MKRPFILYWLMGTATVALSQNNAALKNYGLYGPVKEVRFYQAESRKNISKKPTSVDRFNRDGFAEMCISKTSAKNPKEEFDCYADDENRLVHIRHRIGDSLVGFTNKYYDREGRLEAEEEYMQALLFNKTVYYYKQMNNSKQILAEEPDVIPYLQYRKYIFNEDKTMALYVCYKRNYKKQKIDFHTYTLDTIYYDASGNEIERISYTSDGEFHNRSLMQYDEQNNMVRKELYDRPLASDPKTVFTYAYEYDEYGNWTSAKSNNEDGSLCDYTLREIEYY